MNKVLTQKRLKELLFYNPNTGIFIWEIKPTKNISPGAIAGYKSQGYIRIGINGKKYKASRLAWLYMEGYFPEFDVDHEDKIKDNDRWNNLRHLTRSCNIRNRKLNKNNITGITGVHRVDNKWKATIGKESEMIFLGRFSNFIDAVKARWLAEVKYNYPNCNNTSTAYLYLKERNLL